MFNSKKPCRARGRTDLGAQDGRAHDPLQIRCTVMKSSGYSAALAAGLTLTCGTAWAANSSSVLGTIEGASLSARAYADGTYSIEAPGIRGPVDRKSVV